MQIDLKEARLNYLTLSMSFDMSRETFLEIWAKYFGAASEEALGDWRSEVAEYQLGENRFQLVFQSMVGGDATRSELLLHYMQPTSTESISEERLAAIGRLKDMLDSIGMRCSGSAWGHSVLPSDEVSTIVSLPLIKFQEPHPPFDEVTGIRLVKRTGDKEQSAVSLQMDESGGYTVTISLAFEDTLDSSLPSRATAQLLGWRRRAIWQNAED